MSREGLKPWLHLPHHHHGDAQVLRETQRKYSNILRLARALTSHFYHVVQTQVKTDGGFDLGSTMEFGQFRFLATLVALHITPVSK